ncbi:hypothetical protein ACB092_M000600 [Castanea dentata]
MKRLQKIDGCWTYFLELASNNLDKNKNIRSEQLSAVAESVNSLYPAANLYPYDVKEIWVEVKECYKTWSEVTKIVHPVLIDWRLGKVTPNDWESILRTVPDAVKFQSENFPLADQVQAILADCDEQHVKNLKKKRSEEGSSSALLMKAEKQEISALMHSLDQVGKLNTSLEHVQFCMTLFESKLCRQYFKTLTSDAQKFKFVDDEYRKHLESLQQPPAP